MRVSIVVCNHNYAQFLDDAIRSAVEQDYPNKEVIVVDDGSTDGSRAIVERWQTAIRAVYKSNGGQTSAYNAGFEAVTGEIVLFLDSDDMLDRQACQRIAEAFDARTVKAHFRLRLIDDKGVVLGPTIPKRLADGEIGDRLRLHGELYESAPGSGNAYRVAALRRLMPLPADPKDLHGADFFACYAISLLGEVRALSHEPLGSYRVHRRDAREGLIFGNASQVEPFRTEARYERMQRWVLDRLGPGQVPSAPAPNFSLEKQRFASRIFAANSYAERLRVGLGLLVSNVLPAVRRTGGSRLRRASLAGWAAGIVVLPRTIGLPLARHVCNPASR